MIGNSAHFVGWERNERMFTKGGNGARRGNSVMINRII